MTEWKHLEDPELKQIFRKHFWRGLVFLVILALIIFLLALSFEPQIRSVANWLAEHFGFWGLALTVFISDMIISPLPPDAALFFIGQSSMHTQWFIWVPLLGAVSSAAGIGGWMIGRWLQHLKFFRKIVATFSREHRGSIKRFGFWMVVIGALTPLPFSLTCWLSGIFKLPLKTFFIAALARVPRFVIYYWAIFYSNEIGRLLRQLF